MTSLLEKGLTPKDADDLLMVNRLMRVGQISLGLGVVAVVCILLAAHFLTWEQGKSYLETIQSLSFSKRHLLPTLLLAGLVILALAGIITWMVTLYSTFRVAGPLYRFSRNLEKQIAEGPLPMDKIRDGDLLQEEYTLLAESAEMLQAYYDAMSELVDLARVQLDLPDPNLGGGLSMTIARLRELDQMAKL
ncbi:MAG: hypothetical protein G8345_16710 [Magnetococcales bacterium]|nr:hypothetical protein [Magnetococcales bacterium]